MNRDECRDFFSDKINFKSIEFLSDRLVEYLDYGCKVIITVGVVDTDLKGNIISIAPVYSVSEYDGVVRNGNIFNNETQVKMYGINGLYYKIAIHRMSNYAEMNDSIAVEEFMYKVSNKFNLIEFLGKPILLKDKGI